MSGRDSRRLRGAVLDSLRALSAANDRLDAAVSERLALHRTDMRCLDYLARFGPVPAGRLGDAVGLTSGALTIAVDRLERGGYVHRQPDPIDRRRVLVGLGPCSEQVLGLFAQVRRAALRQLARYSDKELELIDAFVRSATLALDEQARNVRKQPAAQK